LKLYFANFCLHLRQIQPLGLPYLSSYEAFTHPPRLMGYPSHEYPFHEQRCVHLEMIYEICTTDKLLDSHQYIDFEVLYQRNDFILLKDQKSPNHFKCLFDGLQGGFDGALQVLLQQSLALRNAFLCHASCGIFKDQDQTMCMMITGESEAGKSTSVREGGFIEVLTDEMTMIDQIDGVYYAFATPFWSEGRIFEMKNIAHRLDIIAFPIKSNQVQLRPIHQAYAYFKLMQTITCYQLDLSDESAKIQLFHALEKLISSAQIKCYELYFPRFGPWIEEMCLDLHK
jgi:hypothetical protein